MIQRRELDIQLPLYECALTDFDTISQREEYEGSSELEARECDDEDVESRGLIGTASRVGKAAFSVGKSMFGGGNNNMQ